MIIAYTIQYNIPTYVTLAGRKTWGAESRRGRKVLVFGFVVCVAVVVVWELQCCQQSSSDKENEDGNKKYREEKRKKEIFSHDDEKV